MMLAIVFVAGTGTAKSDRHGRNGPDGWPGNGRSLRVHDVDDVRSEDAQAEDTDMGQTREMGDMLIKRGKELEQDKYPLVRA